jgi:hypothetical protein
MIAVMMQPGDDGRVPFKRFKLSSGREIRPDFSKGGIVVVTEAEAIELEAEGWKRVDTKVTTKKVDDKLQRAAMSAGLQCRYQRIYPKRKLR